MGSMRRKNATRRLRKWQEFQEQHNVSEGTVQSVRVIHSRVSELKSNLPESMREGQGMEDWLKQYVQSRRDGTYTKKESPQNSSRQKKKKAQGCNSGKRSDYDPLWARAKTLCRLNAEDVSKAKKLGLKPKTLIKNIPNPQQRWKQPVKYWIHDLYRKQFG